MNAATPVCVTAAHDDYAIWFHVDAGVTAPLLRALEVPACTCLYHVFYSRERIMQLNDTAHTAAYADAIAALLARRPGARLLQADDGVVLATAAAEIGGVTVALPHLSGYARHLHAELFRCALGLPDARDSVASAYARIGFSCRADSHRTPAFSKATFDLAPAEGGMPAGGPFDVLMAEPYYANFQSALPWRGLVHFWYAAAKEIYACVQIGRLTVRATRWDVLFLTRHLRTQWAACLRPEAVIVPAKATLYARLAWLPHLWRAHARYARS